MSKLLQTDIHHLATTRLFSQPASSGTMTLDPVPEQWRATFERATSTEDWDCILRVCQRLPNHIYFAAVEAAKGRDSRSKKLAESRQRARTSSTAFIEENFPKND